MAAINPAQWSMIADSGSMLDWTECCTAIGPLILYDGPIEDGNHRLQFWEHNYPSRLLNRHQWKLLNNCA